MSVDESRGICYLSGIRYRRSPDGTEETVEYSSLTYYPNGDEVESWIRNCGFRILSKFGDRKGNPYRQGSSGRAIFWAGKS